MKKKQRVYTKLRIRLVIYLPLMIAIFMLVSASLVFNFSQGLFFDSETPLDIFYNPVVVWIYLMTAFALIAGIILAWGISRHLEKLTVKAEGLVFPNLGQSTEVSALNEVDALGLVLDKATISLNKFVQDSQILDRLPEGVMTINLEWEIISLNERSSELLDIKPIEAKGAKIQDLIPDTRENRPFYQMIKEGFEGIKTPAREVTVSLNGKREQSLWTKVSLLLNDKTNAPENIMIILKDPMDIKSIRTQFQRLEQLAAIGTMASGIAHEVRNPLGSIRGMTELIGEDLSQNDPKMIYVKEVLNQVDLLNRLIEDVLTFSKDSISNSEEVDVAHILGQAVTLASHIFPDKEVKVIEDYQPGLPKIETDANKIIRAFLNLIINAIEASPEKGWVNVTANVEETEKVNKEKSIVVNITDFGVGITSEDMSRIYEPFYSTKKSGTGLGLTLSQNIIANEGGNIEVFSKPGGGTTFQVILPAKVTT
ncbi:MAG: ATP-binding protein [Pseudomonadota bacterium]